MPQRFHTKYLGLAEYESTFRAMQAANKSRTPEAQDEIWLLEHPPVFTLGLAGKLEHLLAPGDIPVVKIDRGGQVTYHGPGQLVVYLMLDVKCLGYGVKVLVNRIEQSLIDLLGEYGINSFRLKGMPGVYVDSPSLAKGRGANLASLPVRERGWRERVRADDANVAKIAAIGLRIANHATYHGLSLNIDMELEPFSRINPCGYEGLVVTQMRDLGVTDNMAVIGEKLVAQLQRNIYKMSS